MMVLNPGPLNETSWNKQKGLSCGNGAGAKLYGLLRCVSFTHVNCHLVLGILVIPLPHATSQRDDGGAYARHWRARGAGVPMPAWEQWLAHPNNAGRVRNEPGPLGDLLTRARASVDRTASRSINVAHGAKSPTTPNVIMASYAGHYVYLLGDPTPNISVAQRQAASALPHACQILGRGVTTCYLSCHACGHACLPAAPPPPPVQPPRAAQPLLVAARRQSHIHQRWGTICPG
jgi:hypothetical protein